MDKFYYCFLGGTHSAQFGTNGWYQRLQINRHVREVYGDKFRISSSAFTSVKLKETNHSIGMPFPYFRSSGLATRFYLHVCILLQFYVKKTHFIMSCRAACRSSLTIPLFGRPPNILHTKEEGLTRAISAFTRSFPLA